jgi:hypothetical protein
MSDCAKQTMRTIHFSRELANEVKRVYAALRLLCCAAALRQSKIENDEKKGE